MNRLIVVVGQSNERGNDTATLRKSVIGACADPIPPKGTSYGSWWPIVVDNDAERGIKTRVRVAAVGGTGVVMEWCGDTSGVGTGTPYDMNDGGFDPNGYFADALAEATAGTFDEVIVVISFGQRDSVLNVSAANFQLGLENAVNYFLSNGVKVALGFSCFKTGADSWYQNNGNVGYQAALATFANNSNVIEGANLYEGIGTGVELPDGDHMASRGYEIAGQLWSNALS